MTKTFRRLLAVAPFALVVSAVSAQAQEAGTITRPVSIGITGGLTVPTGDAGDFLESGFNAGALLEFTSATLPVAFRINGEYQRFSGKNAPSNAVDLRIISGTADVVYKFGGVMARPYVLGGVGLFNVGATVEDADSENKFGFNVGAGLELPLSGITAFADVRYQSIQTEGNATNLIPIRVGIRF
ncbi:MAG: outer membrane beta-barrel protein [Gemmatirosa sp.]